MDCQLCKLQKASYTCPRCNIKFCSTACYKSENHQQCSEEFYKECVIKELQQQQSVSGDQKNVLEMLKRLEEPESDTEYDDLDSDDDQSENDDLPERLAGVDINNADEVWKRLTNDEKQEFKSLVYNGKLEEIVKPVEPWWKLTLDKKLVTDVAADQLKIKEFLKKCPKVPRNIADFDKMSNKLPAKCIIYGVANVIGAYCFVYRYYNGDHLSYEIEATENLISVCENFKSNSNFESISAVTDSIMLNCHNLNLFF